MAKEQIRYGRCTNPECVSYGMSIPMSENGLCPDCGRPLEESDSDDLGIEGSTGMTSQQKQKIFVFVILLALVGIGVGIFFGVRAIRHKAVGKAEVERLEALAKARQDSIDSAAAAEAARLAAEQQAAELAAAEAARLEAEAAAAAEAARLAEEEVAKAKKAPAFSSRAESGRLSYGKWSGSWKSGKPNGTGTMRYTEEHLIDSRDPQKRVAQAGDYIIGEFANGRLVQGVWYDSSNNVKGSIIIGM